MTGCNARLVAGICAIIVIGWAAQSSAQATKRYNVGYFEAGEYRVHSILREEFARQLRLILPESCEVVFVPEGYRSAGWKRDSCRIMAGELAAVKGIDMEIAMGPWVVEDLLEAGFAAPILAMHQFDPVAQGLVGSDGRPVTSNLTVHVRRGRLQSDLTTLTKLVDLKRLGVLYFPSGDEAKWVISEIDSLGKAAGFETVTAEGFDNYGTYAFFKAYHQLDKQIDALYLPPLWGMDDVKIDQFLSMVTHDKIPVFTSEGIYLVRSGAFGSSAAYSVVSEARYNAVKAARILQGELPASLPIQFRGGTALALNEGVAQECGVSLPIDAVNSAYLVAAPSGETTAHYGPKDAVSRAMSYNPGYQARQEALEAAVQVARQAYSSYLPRLVSGLSAVHLDDNTIANSRGTLENDQYRATLLLDQTIFSAEAIKSIQLAAKRRSREEIDLQESKLDLELAVTAAYLNYLEALERLRTQMWCRSLIDRNLEIAGTRLMIEEGSQIDVLRWQDERHQVTSRIIRARSSLEVAGVLLNVLFNLPGDNPFTLDTLTFSESGFWKDYQLLHGLVPTQDSQEQVRNFFVQEALSKNPSIISRDVGVAVQKDLLSKNSARYFPTLDFRASFDYAHRLPDSPPDFVEKNATWSVWGGLVLPIFLGSDRIRERAVLKAKLSQAEYERDAASLEVMGKTSAGASDLLARLNSVPRAIRSAELARENLKLVSEEYDAGRLGLVDMLDALDNACEAELTSITERSGFYLSMARLVHDAGWSAYSNRTTFRDLLCSRLGGRFGR